MRINLFIFPVCDPQQELDVIDRPDTIWTQVHIFLGLTTKCAGRLSSISIYAEAAGTVYVDLWKETDAGTDHSLVFTHPVSTRSLIDTSQIDIPTFTEF